jgi:uncharacterized protein YndB with AHSA1/START domain
MSDDAKPANSPMDANSVSPAAAPPRRRSSLLLILGGLAAIVGGFCGYVAMLPDDFQIVRSGTIKAPPEKVFPHVNDLHKWEDWSPWAKRDPQAKNTFEGPTEGTGSSFAWDGNSEIGAGTMTILDSHPTDRIQIDLHFIRPFEGKSNVEFTFTPKDDTTIVVWKMSGKHKFMEKAMCLFMNMDKLVGGDFEKGLASMKKVVEAEDK